VFIWDIAKQRPDGDSGDGEKARRNLLLLEIELATYRRKKSVDVVVGFLYERNMPYEYEVVRRWQALSPYTCLPLSRGGWCQILFAGHAGSAAGPDGRDVVLRFLSVQQYHAMFVRHENLNLDALSGDIEFHVRSSDWRMHRHQYDPRYNAVILHAVLICDDLVPTKRQDGVIVPVCSLADVGSSALQLSLPIILLEESSWPCQRLLPQLDERHMDRLLLAAGLQRFEEKRDHFLEDLHATIFAQTDVDPYDQCLFLALAEGLGYGRDRALFRAVGAHLLWKTGSLPEPLGQNVSPAPLDTTRLQVLSLLFERWRIPGIWHILRRCLLPSENDIDSRQILIALRVLFCELGLSLARTDIIICNVVLPFAAAVALLERSDLLAERAKTLYLQHPGLPSNRVTRLMTAQLSLSEEPHGSCRQQGLQHIYSQTCREKKCDICSMGKHII
jgi:hypothetical protein